MNNSERSSSVGEGGLADSETYRSLMREWHLAKGHKGRRMSALYAPWMDLWKNKAYDDNLVSGFFDCAKSLLGKPTKIVAPFKIEYIARCVYYYRRNGLFKASGRSELSGFKTVKDQYLDCSRDLGALMLEHALALALRFRADRGTLQTRLRSLFDWHHKFTKMAKISPQVAVDYALQLSTARHVLAYSDKPTKATPARAAFNAELRLASGDRKMAITATSKKMKISPAALERLLEWSVIGMK